MFRPPVTGGCYPTCILLSPFFNPGTPPYSPCVPIIKASNAETPVRKKRDKLFVTGAEQTKHNSTKMSGRTKR
jgi:hypothetical protein